jgi:hypothetical protein
MMGASPWVEGCCKMMCPSLCMKASAAPDTRVTAAGGGGAGSAWRRAREWGRGAEGAGA